MISGKHIASDALALVALPPTSLQRQAAEAHATSCPECARALRQGERLLELLDASLDYPEPTAATLDRAMRRARRTAALHIVGPPAATVLGIAGLIALLSSFPGEGWRWAASAALAIVGVVLSWFAISGRRMRWTLTAVLLSSAVFAAAFAGEGSLEALFGIRCCVAELVPVAIGVAVMRALRQSSAFRDRWRAAALVGGSGLTVQAALLVSCPARMSALHMLVFHAGALAAICAAAAWLAPRLAPAARAAT